ncbi:MAG TPA: peptidoglycan editing factor PgeF [Thermohalobaculum sp.]|nr:peptidoglycan editing factor PgeF [Thermohalobaculum sp.]
MNPILSETLRHVAHGFYTREGGVSEGIFESLNCGMGSGDDADAVAENRERLRRDMGADALVSVHQYHSDQVVEVDRDWGRDRPKADAMVCRTPGMAIGILTADCAPVLLADAEGGVVGAAHAGWKGALGGVLEAVIEAMIARGARRERIAAAVGPLISQPAYEVGPEFVEQFVDEDPGFGRFFSGGREDRAQFDLAGFCLSRLREAGIADAGWTGHCTYRDPGRFFSYRRATHEGGRDYGRLCAAIML